MGSTVTSVYEQHPHKNFLEEFPSLEGILELVDDDFQTISISRSSIDFRSANIDDNLNKLSRDLKMPDVVRKRWVLRMNECIKSGKQIQFDFDRNIESRRYFFSVTMLFIGESSGRPRFSYILRDITSLKRSEQELLESRNRMQIAEDFGNIGTWDWDVSSDVIIWSATTLRILGLKDDSGIYTLHSFLPRVFPDDRNALKVGLESSMDLKSEFYGVYRVLLEDGSIRWIEGRGRGIYDQNGVCARMLGVAIDITERKNFERALEDQRSSIMFMSKMSALGEMAGAIAHEVNNPLTVIRCKSAVIKNDLRDVQVNIEKLRSDVAEIDAMAARIAKIVEGMRFFCRDGSGDAFALVSLNQILTEVVTICSERFKSRGISLEIPSVPTDLEVRCQSVQIGQVFINLLNNAYDAVENSDEKIVKIDVHAETKRVNIVVSDSGCGIPKEISSKIFQPFFTTKAAARGTGIGLSIVDGIIQAHQGTIAVDSTEGRTCFTVSLPLFPSQLNEDYHHA